jgi:hypothetical protein
MAVFLLKAEHGSNYTPPACAGVFSDVACPSQFADWIEQLAAEGVTAGCGTGIYCPDSPVTRAQMAPFLLKAVNGPGYVPPACTGEFTDVPALLSSPTGSRHSPPPTSLPAAVGGTTAPAAPTPAARWPCS